MNGLSHGRGTLTILLSEKTYEGNFYKGLIHGDCKITQPGAYFFVGKITRKLTKSLDEYDV